MENKKEYRIKWETSPYNPNFYQLKVTFNRPDGVKLIEILEALKSVNQEKLYKAFNNQGVSIFVQKGYMLGNVSQKTYEKYLEKVVA